MKSVLKRWTLNAKGSSKWGSAWRVTRHFATDVVQVGIIGRSPHLRELMHQWKSIAAKKCIWIRRRCIDDLLHFICMLMLSSFTWPKSQEWSKFHLKKSHYFIFGKGRWHLHSKSIRHQPSKKKKPSPKSQKWPYKNIWKIKIQKIEKRNNGSHEDSSKF